MSDLFVSGAVPIDGRVRKLKLAAAGTVSIPAGAIVTRVSIRNKTTNVVTGGIKVGTTLGGVDVLAAGAIGASALVSYIALAVPADPAAAKTIYIDAVTGWNSAIVDIVVEYICLL